MTPIPILLYHSVGHTSAPTYRRWCIDPSLFGEHLSALRSEGYDFLTVSGLVDAVDADALPERPLLVTFDDGRADYVEHAVPQLAAHGVVSTMYVVSSQVGGTSAWLGIPGESDQPMMTWGDMHAAVASGHEVGSHSRTHPQLDVIAHRASVAEITDSRLELEDGLGATVRSFAYPHGHHRQREVDAVRAAGYDSGCAVADRWSWLGQDRYRLSRLIVDGETTADELLVRLSSPPAAPRHRSAVLRCGFRCVRRIRHRSRRVVSW
jgi:peptidoglycan/xylan/chitin deacetylase (PgdA/CDA1 family)